MDCQSLCPKLIPSLDILFLKSMHVNCCMSNIHVMLLFIHVMLLFIHVMLLFIHVMLLFVQEKVDFLRSEGEELRRREASMMEKYQRESEYKIQHALAQYKQEVDSLRAVMELRNAEIHELRRQNIEKEKQVGYWMVHKLMGLILLDRLV